MTRRCSTSSSHTAAIPNRDGGTRFGGTVSAGSLRGAARGARRLRQRRVGRKRPRVPDRSKDAWVIPASRDRNASCSGGSRAREGGRMRLAARRFRASAPIVLLRCVRVYPDRRRSHRPAVDAVAAWATVSRMAIEQCQTASAFFDVGRVCHVPVAGASALDGRVWRNESFRNQGERRGACALLCARSHE